MTTALATRSNFEAIRAMARSDEVLSRFTEVLGPSAPTFISSLLIAVQGNDKLMECTPQSIILAGMRAATLRLSCDPGLGQAYPVPYWNSDKKCYQAQFQIGYKGMIQLAMRTGKYRYLNVARVYEGQTVVEDQLRGIHTIAGFRTSEKVCGYMLYFQLVGGFEKTFYMTIEEIMDHGAKYSRTFDQPNGFWKKQTDDMCKKTVLLKGLRRWGYFDPNDALDMATAKEDAPIEEDDTLDIEFADTPAHSEEENMRALGFETEQKAPEQQQEQPAISPELEHALKFQITGGRTLGDLSMDELKEQKAKADKVAESKRGTEYMKSVAALALVMKYREAQPA